MIRLSCGSTCLQLKLNKRCDNCAYVWSCCSLGKKNKERKGHNMSTAMDMDYFGLCEIDSKGEERESCTGDKQARLQHRRFGYKNEI